MSSLANSIVYNTNLWISSNVMQLVNHTPWSTLLVNKCLCNLITADVGKIVEFDVYGNSYCYAYDS